MVCHSLTILGERKQRDQKLLEYPFEKAFVEDGTRSLHPCTQRRSQSHSKWIRGLDPHKAQWENERLQEEAHLSRESLLMSSNSDIGYHTNKTVQIITMPRYNPPNYLLKIWNLEAGKVFRKGNHHTKGRGDDPVLWSENPLSLVSSPCYTSTHNSCDKSLKPNDKHKDNGFQQCNYASFEWIGDSNVKAPVD
jgi:hypothetical protein